MGTKWHIATLTDLFYALFRPAEQQDPVIRGQKRLFREDYFALFFPDSLCSQYLSKSKSNLTWFFNDDRKNKAIKHTLIELLDADCQRVMDEMHQKCRNVLWPKDRHPSFSRSGLWEVLGSIRVKSSLNARLRILDSGAARQGDQKPRLLSYFEADPSAALMRVILTLAIASDAGDDILTRIWDETAQQLSTGFLTREKSIEGQIRYGKLLYLNGSREQAFQVFEKIAHRLNRPAADREESLMYCRMASMLLTGDGHFRDHEAARKYLELGCHSENPESYYLLSKQLEGTAAMEALEKGAELGCISAIRELGNAWFSGNPQLGCLQNLDNAGHWYRQGASADNADGAYCTYMLGRIYEERGETGAAVSSYIIARERGSQEACDRLMRLDWYDSGMEDSFQTNEEILTCEPLRYCLMNQPGGNNRIFAGSLKGSWQLTVCSPQMDLRSDNDKLTLLQEEHSSVSQALKRLGADLFDPAQACFPEVNICLLSQNHQDNLLQCIEVLHVLQRLASRLESRKWELVDAVSIYVEAEHDYASLMLDAAFRQLQGNYFRVRLCDPATDCIDQLFSSAPIFLPRLANPDLECVHMVILGTSDAALAAVRRAVSLPVSENSDLTITVFGEDADRMSRCFFELCPGIRYASPMIHRTIPQFVECPLKNGGLARLTDQLRSLQRGSEAEHAEAELLSRGNYFIIATEDDELNVRLGTGLRAELLKLDPSFTKLPFIAAHVSNPIASWLTRNISTGAAQNDQGWHSNYSLHSFGAATLYTYDGFKNDVLEHRAQAVHLQYSGMPEDPTERHLALSSYYRRQYNRDSSRAMAQYLIYRLFTAGIALPDWRLYGIPDEEAKLVEAYENWISEGDHLPAAARMEHVRWNCFMLSMGWEQATPVQVATYIQRGNPGHQLHMAKLHPFICDWHSLETGELVREVEDAVRSLYPEKRIHDPLSADAQAVCYTSKLLKTR